MDYLQVSSPWANTARDLLAQAGSPARTLLNIAPEVITCLDARFPHNLLMIDDLRGLYQKNLKM